MTWAFVQSAVDMIKPDYGYTAFGALGGVFVDGVGMLALGVPLMLLCFAFGTKRFFRGETLNAQTEVKVPDVYYRVRKIAKISSGTERPALVDVLIFASRSSPIS